MTFIRLKRLSRKLFSTALDTVFPPKCLGCFKDVESGSCCIDCFQKIEINSSLYCGACGSRLPENKKVCHKDFPFILGFAVNYEDQTIKNLVHALKFNGVENAAETLSELMVAYWRRIGLEEEFILIPIPLNKRRKNQRGYNQAELLANNFSKAFRLPIYREILIRKRSTKAQSTLSPEERRKNIKGAFEIRRPELIEGRSLILIDDVITSGSTMLEAARTLKGAGARKIIALTAAKAG